MRAYGAFTVGSTLRHVLVMTATGSVGLVAVFFVDFLTLLYVSRLGDTHLTAAVGYASQLMFLIISVNIGISIAIGARVSQALGAGNRPRARRIAASGLCYAALVSGALSLGAMPFTHAILHIFGARGETLAVGSVYLRIILPASVLLAIGMACSSVLRGVGDAKRAMYVTLGGAVVTACLDPIAIFALHGGIYGAGAVLVLSRFALLLIGLHGTVRVHDLVQRPRFSDLARDWRPLAGIAGPAILTNLAAPIANIYVLHVFSRFGEAVVAAFAIMDRVTPVAFGVLFALSGSVGPIMGQNYGARLHARVRAVLNDSFIVAAFYTAAVTLILWLASPLVVSAFSATGETAELLRFFCAVAGPIWLFLGAIFVSNAVFNNLDAPLLSTAFNWGRATFGTVPFVALGVGWGGPRGGYLGLAAGAALFGCFAVVAAYVVVGRIARPAPAR